MAAFDRAVSRSTASMLTMLLLAVFSLDDETHEDDGLKFSLMKYGKRDAPLHACFLETAPQSFCSDSSMAFAASSSLRSRLVVTVSHRLWQKWRWEKELRGTSVREGEQQCVLRKGLVLDKQPQPLKTQMLADLDNSPYRELPEVVSDR
jgi:hypothetical protein